MARFVAVAILLALGVGIYAFMQTSNLNVAELKLGAAERRIADLEKKMLQNNTQTKTSATELASCQEKVTELQTALDSSKKPGAKR